MNPSSLLSSSNIMAAVANDSFTVGLRGLDERLSVTLRHDVYPAIDPQEHYDAQTFKNEVVLVTGASKGIGAGIALGFARGGAAVVLMARQQSTLDDSQAEILKAVPEARTLTIVADVVDWKASEAAVEAAVTHFGRLSVLVCNAGTTTKLETPITDKDPEAWWRTFEVNVRGVFNFARAALPYLKDSKGYFFALGSGGAQVRMRGGSDYNTSKHAVNRFVEYVALENSEVKAITLNPGRIATALADAAGLTGPGSTFVASDTVELPVATILYLAAGKADWLSGRYVSCNWDLAEVESDYKAKILEKDVLVNKLSMP
ncbi:NAD-P-binding protein [Peniophora sp. CONT]|nr:NAD-P-binding protein [Peniophora sp. CONT]